MSHRAPAVEDLERPSRLRRQRVEWWIERVGWSAIALVLVAAALGLLGPGAVSRRRIASADGALVVEYDRLVRQNAPQQLRLHWTGASATRHRLLIVSREFAAIAKVEGVMPLPTTGELGERETKFRFPATGQSQSLVIRCRFDTWGPVRYWLKLDDGEPLDISQFVFP